LRSGSKAQRGRGQDKESMVTAYLSIGSNIGNRMKNLEQISEILDGIKGVNVREYSSVYETAPVGGVKQRNFYNAVLKVRTALSPIELLLACKRVESSLGRKKSVKWGPRIADIDILIYGNKQFRSTKLVIPHKEIARRAFVLFPLYELAPGIRIPGVGHIGRAIKALIDLKEQERPV